MPGPSLAYRNIPVEILTASHQFSGDMRVTATGLLGAINDPQAATLELHQARLARINLPNKQAARFEVVRIVRRQILAGAVTRREDVGPWAVPQPGNTRLREVGVMITSPVYEVQGTILWPGKFDPEAWLLTDSDPFFPVYNARLTAALARVMRLECPAVVFNRVFVDSVSLFAQLGEEIL